MSFPPGTEMFQFSGFASPKLCIHLGDDFSPITQLVGPTSRIIGEAGLPHSEIVGSMPAHGSPTLIAACHVLHRLYMPRHPPVALTSRLRVHTTNNNAGSITRPKLGRAAKCSLLVWMIISALLSTRPSRRTSTIGAHVVPTISSSPKAETECRHGIDLKNPFTMSKKKAVLGPRTGRYTRISCLHQTGCSVASRRQSQQSCALWRASQRWPSLAACEISFADPSRCLAEWWSLSGSNR